MTRRGPRLPAMANGESARGTMAARLPARLRRAVVTVLLGVWCFPAVSLAAPPADRPAQHQQAAATARDRPGPSAETAELAARERQAPALQDFRGGGVSIYIGSGVLLVVVIVLLIVLLV
jgi:hypothetical protein